MFFNNSPDDRCDQLFGVIKKSQLNFCAQETPFSLNLQIKKKFIKTWSSEQLSEMSSSIYSETKFEHTAEATKYTQDETINLKVKIEKLEAENKSLNGNIVDLGNKLRETESIEEYY